jgi:DNA-binding PadR family transcriptional regulator
LGLGMLEELGRHGYRISAGTLYPILHGLDKQGYLRSIRSSVQSRPSLRVLRRLRGWLAFGGLALQAIR